MARTPRGAAASPCCPYPPQASGTGHSACCRAGSPAPPGGARRSGSLPPEKKLGGSGASEAQKGTAKRRSVFSRAPQWKSRLFWVEIAAPAAGENYVLKYGDAKRKPKGAFALEGATVDAVADTEGDFRLHARVGRAWVTVRRPPRAAAGARRGGP